ncbi:unnamed protein product [Linum trigynum]|uniref:CCHC-type domain-containing protein n=1 Tax=Linum trigynum TaxID=586398 RepID=A0AAV2GSA6_9ROSI
MIVTVVTAQGQEEELQGANSPGKGMDSQHREGMNFEPSGAKASYKDSFLGNSPPISIPEGDELMSDESEGEEAEDDPDCPTIRIKKSTDARIRNRWSRAITFRVLGKLFPFAFIHRRIQNMWAKTGGIKVGDIGNGYFQATFDSQLDHDRALYGGPWTIEDHYIAAEPWRLDFDPDFDTINRAAVWVRLPRLPLAYFDEEILYDIGDKIGRVEKIDYNTANGSRGNYARICVEIDLRKRLVSKYRIKRRVRRVEYEGLHTVCFKCGRYGHLEDGCTQSDSMGSNPEEKVPLTTSPPQKQEIRPEILEDFGPWMLATRTRRKTRQPLNQRKAKDNLIKESDPDNEGHGSRFSVLESEEAEKEDVDETNEKEVDTCQTSAQATRKQTDTIRDDGRKKDTNKESKVAVKKGKDKQPEKSKGIEEPKNIPLKADKKEAPKGKKQEGNSNATGRKTETHDGAGGTLNSKGLNKEETKANQHHKQQNVGTSTPQHAAKMSNERGKASGARAGHQPMMHQSPGIKDSKEKAKKKFTSPENGTGQPKRINFDLNSGSDTIMPESATLHVDSVIDRNTMGEEMAMAIDK